MACLIRILHSQVGILKGVKLPKLAFSDPDFLILADFIPCLDMALTYLLLVLIL